MRFHGKRALALLLVAVAAGHPRRARAEAERVPIVAVFEIDDATNRPKRLVASLTDYLRVKLAESRAIKVVDKGDQEAQLKKLIRSEKKKSYKACVDQSCQVPLGKELAADKILRGKLTRFGKSYVISLEMIDLATGASAGAASDKSNGTEEQLMASVERIAHTISASILPPKSEAPPETAADAGDKEAADKGKVEVAAAKPLPQAQPTAATQNPPVTATTKLESPGPTGGQYAMIIGGWAVFAGAYLTEIFANLLTSDFSRTYYSLAPVIGPVLIEQLNKSTTVGGGTMGTTTDQYKANPLNYVDAGVQLAGALVAVLGHVLALSNPPVAVPVTPAGAAPQQASIDFVAMPRFVGISARF